MIKKYCYKLLFVLKVFFQRVEESIRGRKCQPHVLQMTSDGINRQLACWTNFWFRQKKVNSRKELIKISKIAKFGCEML
jgi:hypothetical protein